MHDAPSHEPTEGRLLRVFGADEAAGLRARIAAARAVLARGVDVFELRERNGKARAASDGETRFCTARDVDALLTDLSAALDGAPR